jgi:hypothetical protein
MAYDWTPFDRKYVINAPVDLAVSYPADRRVPEWDPDVTKRR